MSSLDHRFFAGISSVMFVHAHPDDETIGTGALIAALSAAGMRVWLVTATRGEQGEVVVGTVDPGLSPDELSAVREAELTAALAALGNVDQVFLGRAPARADGLPDRRYLDSGMEWRADGRAGPSGRVGPGSLTAAASDEVVADLVTMINTAAPDLLISYDASGGYGHPDHVALHAVTVQAGQLTDTPVAEILEHTGDGVVWFDLADQRVRLVNALRAHASQLTVVDGGVDAHIVHVGGQRDEIRTGVGLRMIPPA